MIKMDDSEKDEGRVFSVSSKMENNEMANTPKLDIFFTTTDILSIGVMVNITSGYMTEANIRFDNKGISLIEGNESNDVLIEAVIPKENLLQYQYSMQSKIYCAGFELKKLQSNFNSITSKQICNMYKIAGDDNFFTIGEITLNKDGANKLKTCRHSLFQVMPPDSPKEPLVKITTSDFTAMCSSLGKLSCKKIEFSKGKNTLYVKGMKDDRKSQDGVKNVVSARSFKNSSLFEENLEDVEEEGSLTIKYNLIKPLIKINKICKNGFVNVYFYKVNDNNMLLLKVNIGQVGFYSIYFRDSQ